MTHLILIFLQIAIAVLISMLLLAFEHYFPWKRFGISLNRPAAYTLGVLSIVLPQFGLWLMWAQQAPVGNAFLWCMGSLASSIILSGMTVYILYLIDGRHDAEMSARMARLAEHVWRDRYEPDDC